MATNNTGYRRFAGSQAVLMVLLRNGHKLTLAKSHGSCYCSLAGAYIEYTGVTQDALFLSSVTTAGGSLHDVDDDEGARLRAQ